MYYIKLNMEVKGYPNYLIYPDGKVKNIKTNRILKHKKEVYDRVRLQNEDGVKLKCIHRLIAEHYIPNPENKPEVDHIDRNKKNNSIENLRWTTKSENCRNKSKQVNNTSGHKNIYWDRNRKRWSYRVYGKNKYLKYSYSKTEILCYKFIYLMKQRIN